MTIPIENQPMSEADWRDVVRYRLPRLDGHAHDPDEVADWVTAGRHKRWTRAEVVAALAALITEFHRYRIVPGHFNEKITELRAKVSVHWYCPDPPRRLADDPRGEIEWRRAAQRDYSDRALIALASGEPLEDVPMTLDPEADPPRVETPAARRRLDAMVADVAATKAVPAEPAPAERPAVDPQRMAAARDELDVARRNTAAATA